MQTCYDKAPKKEDIPESIKVEEVVDNNDDSSTTRVTFAGRGLREFVEDTGPYTYWTIYEVRHTNLEILRRLSPYF